MELVLEDITKKYKDKTAVQNVSATLHSGQLIGLIGKNGAGKTTLLKLLSTILKPAGGRILLDGQDIVKNPNVMRSKAGYLPQEVSAYPNLTVLEYLSYIASVKGIKKKDAEKQINSLLTDFHLENAKGRRMGNCSGGMKQRAGIICALLGDPQIIIIDEPATGLDPEERVAVRNILSRLSRERIVILSTHIVSDIEAVASRILLLQQGSLVFNDSPEKLIARAKGCVWEYMLPSLPEDYERQLPMIGLSFVKNNISMDRESGLLYNLQSMNMKKGNYVIGKFLSNLSVLTVMWLFVMHGAVLMFPFRFSDQPLPFYDFISPFIGIYPGIIFASAFAVLLESVPFISSKAGNAVGLTALFVMFLVNYSASSYNNPLPGAFDYGNYRWVMDSINNAVVPIIRRGVRETGILVPGGMFAGSKGGQELVFHGLLWNWQYLIDKIILTAISMALILSAVILLETAEKNKKASSRSPREKERKGGKSSYCTNQFMMECRLLLKSLPKGCLAVNVGLWIYSIFAPLQYVQGYLWIIMLICSVALFSQMGCREHENSLTECFVTIKFSLVRQMAYSYLWGVVILFMLSAPTAVRCFMEQKFLCSFCYIVFSLFVPALACFSGECSRSRRAFETVYLLICFLLLNMPSFLFQGYVAALMLDGTVVFLTVALIKRLHL